MQRRQFIGSLGALGVGLGIGRIALAGPATGPRFLLVFLRGGYDCANAVVPYGSSFYYESRPTLAIPRPVAGDDLGSIALDGDWALAPALRATVGALYARGEAAFIPFAGTDDLSRSHFETQDSIELGRPLGGARDFQSGFLGRLAAELVDGRPIAFTDALPQCLRGAQDVPNLSLKNLGPPPFDDRQARLIRGMYAGHRLESSVADGLELKASVAREFEDEMTAASRGALSTRGFELEAERIGRLMRDRYRIGFIDVGGWDTHVNQGSTRGTLASNLEGLGRGLAAFAETLGDDWSDTVVVVLSEFGRTFRENGNRGTDHGHGSAYWVLGGGVHGGRVAGEQVRLVRGALLQDRDYPVLNDYRAVLGGLFARLWGLSPAAVDRIFPGARPVDLGFV